MATGMDTDAQSGDDLYTDLNGMEVEFEGKTLPSFGLCPFRSEPTQMDMLFNRDVGEDCRDENNMEIYVPCLFSGGFYCIAIFMDEGVAISGCIRGSGGKLVTFQEPADNSSRAVQVVEFNGLSMLNPCASREKRCAPAEIIRDNFTAIYPTCCCKGRSCASPEGYGEHPAIKKQIKDTPFRDLHQLFILAVAYASTAAAITMVGLMSLHKKYTNWLILKNR